MSTDTARFATIDPSEWSNTGLYCRTHPHVHLQGAVLVNTGSESGNNYLLYCSASRRVLPIRDRRQRPPDPQWGEWQAVAIFPEGWQL